MLNSIFFYNLANVKKLTLLEVVNFIENEGLHLQKNKREFVCRRAFWTFFLAKHNLTGTEIALILNTSQPNTSYLNKQYLIFEKETIFENYVKKDRDFVKDKVMDKFPINTKYCKRLYLPL